MTEVIEIQQETWDLEIKPKTRINNFCSLMIWPSNSCLEAMCMAFMYHSALLFHELSAQLSTLGFWLFDVVDPLRRKVDSALWQADAINLKHDYTVFKTPDF